LASSVSTSPNLSEAHPDPNQFDAFSHALILRGNHGTKRDSQIPGPHDGTQKMNENE
jgi:hypothetical protein